MRALSLGMTLFLAILSTSCLYESATTYELHFLAEDGSVTPVDSDASIVFGTDWIGLETEIDSIHKDTTRIQSDLLTVQLTIVDRRETPLSRTLYYKVYGSSNETAAQVWLSDVDMEGGFEGFALRGTLERIPMQVRPDSTAMESSSVWIVEQLLSRGKRSSGHL